MKPISSKPLVEVQPDHYRILKVEAAKCGRPMKQLTAVLLDYALEKLTLGKIHFVDPAVAEGPAPTPAQKPRRRKEVAS